MYSIPDIPNSELRLEHLPSPDDDWGAIGEFALTFPGYEYWGSFDRCADIANERRAESLADLRTCLFFEQRRWRHFGEEPDDETMQYIRGIIEHIREMLKEGADQ